MKCQVCGATADIHVTDLRGSARFHYHVCSRHQSAASDGSLQPLTDAQNTKLLREGFESSVTDPAALEQIKKAFPEIFDDAPSPDDAP